jgi:hypothetical protein
MAARAVRAHGVRTAGVLGRGLSRRLSRPHVAGFVTRPFGRTGRPGQGSNRTRSNRPDEDPLADPASWRLTAGLRPRVVRSGSMDMTVPAGITAMIALTVASAAAFSTLLGLCLRRDPPGVLPHGARARRAAAASQEGEPS